MSEGLSLYLSAEILQRQEKEKLSCPNKSKGQMHYSISKEQTTKKIFKNTVNRGAGITKRSGESEGTLSVTIFFQTVSRSGV